MLKLHMGPAHGALDIGDGSADWMENYRATLDEAPKLRIRYEVPGIVK